MGLAKNGQRWVYNSEVDFQRAAEGVEKVIFTPMRKDFVE